jgi:hypothetical protein
MKLHLAESGKSIFFCCWMKYHFLWYYFVTIDPTKYVMMCTLKITSRGGCDAGKTICDMNADLIGLG